MCYDPKILHLGIYPTEIYIHQKSAYVLHKLETTQMFIYSRMNNTWDTAVNEPQLHTTRMNIRNHKLRQRNQR